MSSDQAGHFVEGPLLPEVPAPEPDAILVRGAKLVRVYGPDGPSKRDAGREAIVLAWTRLRDGWGILLAWTSYYAYDNPPHQTALARHGWYRFDERRVKPTRPPRKLYEGAVWHGWHADSELNAAIHRAAETLPEDMREAAVIPAQVQGPPGASSRPS